MTAPKVSVIVPVYNVATYLPQCLDSILVQTLKDIEIIIVDDGSIDSSPQICDEYADKNKHIMVIHQKNKGLSGARNTGMATAKGQFLAFVDSDDWIEPTMLEKLYLAAEKDKSNVAVCNVNLCAPQQTVQPKDYWPYPQDCVLQPSQFYKHFLIAPCWVWNKLYRRTFLQKKKITFVEGILYEDVPFFTEVFLQTDRVSFVADYLYNYRIQRDGAITVKPSAKQLDILKVKTIVAQLLQKHSALPLLQSNFADWILWSHIWMYEHLPLKYRHQALRQIEKLPQNLAAGILEHLDIWRGMICIFGMPLLSFKRVKSRTDVFFCRIPLITFRRKGVI